MTSFGFVVGFLGLVVLVVVICLILNYIKFYKEYVEGLERLVNAQKDYFSSIIEILLTQFLSCRDMCLEVDVDKKKPEEVKKIMMAIIRDSELSMMNHACSTLDCSAVDKGRFKKKFGHEIMGYFSTPGFREYCDDQPDKVKFIEKIFDELVRELGTDKEGVEESL